MVEPTARYVDQVKLAQLKAAGPPAWASEHFADDVRARVADLLSDLGNGATVLARTFDYGRRIGVALETADGRRFAVKLDSPDGDPAAVAAEKLRAQVGGGNGTGREAAAVRAGD